MFSGKDNAPVDLTYNNTWNPAEWLHSSNLRDRVANNLLLAGFITVRKNCEAACSTKLLNDDNREEYLKNTRIGQVHLKSKNDDLQKSMDSCIRRCFVQRLNDHFGKEIQPYVHLSAFEYQQDDFLYFKVKDVGRQEVNKKIDKSHKFTEHILKNYTTDLTSTSTENI